MDSTAATQWQWDGRSSGAATVGIVAAVLEENAWANPDARIHPLTHVSVDRAYQAELVGSNSLLSTLICYLSLSNL